MPPLSWISCHDTNTHSIRPISTISKGMDYYCTIQLSSGFTISTICNQGIHDWKLIQRRIDGSVNFWRKWTDYENGFGSRESEFWLGNRDIYELTSDNFRYLRIEMMDHDCVWKYAEYSMFYIEDAANKYRLHIGGYSGDANDSMAFHNGMAFSTYDNDNDLASGNCAFARRGAWWYGNCHKSNLNGEYGNTDNSNGINWFFWKGFTYSLKEVRMMVRKP
uniref:Ficolin-2-like n=1 Tax=Crassostrea virginica TaxID=6565 RepID=A0A8B8C4A9_CRAVI|nr:ficolin-2-like [Crassostrea virginica]